MNQQEKTIRELSDKAFADHKIALHLSQGYYRSWRCQKRGTWNYGFDVTTIPGHLFLTGDLGDLIVSREPDMLPWCLNAVESTSYFAEKVRSGPTREFTHDAFRRWCHETLADSCLPNEHREIVADVLGYCDGYAVSELYERTREVWDGCDPPDWTDWTPRFLWCRDAIRWFVLRHAAESQVP